MKSKSLAVLRDYWRHSARYPLVLAGIFVMSVLIQGTQIIAPIYVSNFIELISASTPSSEVLSRLQNILVIFALVLLSGWVFRRLHHWLAVRLEVNVMADIEEASFSHLLRHSYRFFISNFAGSLVRKVTRYKKSYESIADSIIFNFFPSIVFMAGVLFILYQRSPLIASIFAVWMVLLTLAQIVLVYAFHSLRLKASEEDSVVTGALADAVGNHASIEWFSGIKREESSFRTLLNKLRNANLRAWNADDTTWAVSGILVIGVEIGTFYAGMHLWAKGVLTIGDLVLIQAYLLQLFERLIYLSREIRTVFTALADATEMREILDTEHEIHDAPNATTLSVSSAAVSFESVTFGFNPTRPILQNFSLSIKGGEKVALVGPSGGGKTTITKLLLRLYDVHGGRVAIDETNIRSVTLESLRAGIAYVPQEPSLFHRTLMDNIRYGRPDASNEEVIEAARKAHCDEFIRLLPQGYETFVGERGVKLSGGERQRIAIARAILRDAPILVLDEATSSLDSESESFIQDALVHFMEGRTVIVVAHRLSTIQRMDRIVVVEGGRIVAEGPHATLLETSELYRTLWSIQAGGFLPDSADGESRS